MKKTQIEDSIVSVFEGYPSLCGFTVTRTLEPADLSLFPAPAPDEAMLIHEEIRDTLSQLLEERPEAGRLLAGRTFARALH